MNGLAAEKKKLTHPLPNAGGLPGGANGKEPACQGRRHRDVGSIPGSGRSPRGGHGNPLQYSCLENPTDRGAWEDYSPQGLEEPDTTEAT